MEELQCQIEESRVKKKVEEVKQHAEEEKKAEEAKKHVEEEKKAEAQRHVEKAKAKLQVVILESADNAQCRRVAKIAQVQGSGMRRKRLGYEEDTCI